MAVDMDEQLFRQQHGWSLQLQSGQEIRLTPPGPKEASETLCVTDVFLVDPESAGIVAACVEIGTRNVILGVLSSEKPRAKLLTPVELDEEFCFYLMRTGREGDAVAEADADAVLVQFQCYALPSTSTTMKEIEEEDDEEEDMIDEENPQDDDDDDDDDEVGDGEDTEDDEDATGSDFEGYDIRDDRDTWGLPLGTVIDDGPNMSDEEEDNDGEAGRPAAKASTAGRNKLRHRRSFVTEAEGRSLGGRAPPRFGVDAEPIRRFSPEMVFLGIFVFLYLVAIVLFFVDE